MNFQIESSVGVWTSVFGHHQQYLISLLMVAGPLLARDSQTRWRLAIPPLLLFTVFLNPILTEFISRNITTPPVYWRVVWSFPTLIFSAFSVYILFQRLINADNRRYSLFPLLLIVLILASSNLRFNSLRVDNIGPLNGFAQWKLSPVHKKVALSALNLHGNIEHALLGPSEIAGVISRFEHRPPLINVRGNFYLNYLAPYMAPGVYLQRQHLLKLITTFDSKDQEPIREALAALKVSTVVVHNCQAKKATMSLLVTEHFRLAKTVSDYCILTKN